MARQASPSLSPLERVDPDSALHRHRVARAVVLLACVTLGGTLGFTTIEGWSLWDSFYFTLVTITTVGYGDQGISDAGRKFATVLMVGGVAAASYSFATVVQASISRQLAWRKRMQKRIQKLTGHAIVCGFGRMGRLLAQMLRDDGVELVVLEQDPHAFSEAVAQGFFALQGPASEETMLREAGIAHARCIVSAIDSVAENVLVSMTAKDLCPAVFVYARAERESEVAKLHRAGADRVLSPFLSGAREIAQHIVNPEVADFITQASTSQGDVALATVQVEAGSRLEGERIGDYGHDYATRVSFVVLERSGGETLVPPPGSEKMVAGDLLIVAGDPEQIAGMHAAAAARSAA